MPPTITIPIDDLETARTALEKLEVTAQVGQRILDKVEQYGEAEVIRGLREVFTALSHLLAD